jgi:hypothetical protein
MEEPTAHHRRHPPLTVAEKRIGSVVLVLALIASAWMVQDIFSQAMDMRSHVRNSPSFDLELYLDCHEWRMHSWLGTVIVDCDAMPGINYTTVEPYIWNADLNRELKCTRVSTKRGYKGALPKQCWEGKYRGTFNNYADISHTSAGNYLDCLHRHVKSWPRISNTAQMRLCDPMIPGTYEILMERYKAKAGVSTLDGWRRDR